MSEVSKSDSNEIPTRSGQPRLELEEGSTGDARRARSPIPLRARTEGQRDGQSRARGLPSGLALMKTRTLRPAGTRWEGRAVRFPEKAARRSAESRGQGSLVPAPAGHIALRRDRRRRRRRLLLLGSCPRSAGTARSIPAGSAAQSRSEPEAPPASSRAHSTGRRGAAMRSFPPAVVAAACCPSGRRLLAAGAQRSSRWEREGSVSAATSAAPLCAGKRPRPSPSPRPSISPPAPAGRRGLSRRRDRRARGAAQTLSGKGVPSLWEAASRGFQGGGAGAAGYPGAGRASLGMIPSAHGCLLGGRQGRR